MAIPNSLRTSPREDLALCITQFKAVVTMCSGIYLRMYPVLPFVTLLVCFHLQCAVNVNHNSSSKPVIVLYIIHFVPCAIK